MTAVRGTSVDIPTQEGVADAYLTHPDDSSPHPAVLLYMDAFGLRPHLKKMADRLARAATPSWPPTSSTAMGGPRWSNCPTSSTRSAARRSSNVSARS